jgi:hypothetical protein
MRIKAGKAEATAADPTLAAWLLRVPLAAGRCLMSTMLLNKPTPLEWRVHAKLAAAEGSERCCWLHLP